MPDSNSPTQMDSGTKAQGEKLVDVLQLFKQATTSPTHKTITSEARKTPETTSLASQRKSPRLSAKSSKGKPVIKLAQDLIAKRCGIVPEEDTLEEITLQQYLDMHKKPLPDSSMLAILKLSEVITEKKKKKKCNVPKEKKKMQSPKTRLFETSKKLTSKKKCLKNKEKAPLGVVA
jgi:hypothetical protein